MHRLVPEFILQQYRSGQMRGSFAAVGLFVDISGFSSITDALMAHGQHGAEVLADLMVAVFEPLLLGVYEQGGFVITFAGDAFTALFPLDTGTDAQERALTAAWSVQRRMASVAEQATSYGIFSLAAKVGLAIGKVDWGIVASEDGARAAYYFRGPAVDDCAAAEHLAVPGDIILTGELQAAASGWTETEAVADHYRLTGIIEPLPPPEAVDLPPPDLDTSAHFYPRALLTQRFSGEFRHVVNLFISLPTVRTAEQLAIFMRSLFELQERYGGLLNRIDFGDKGANLLLFWGAPVAHETDIQRTLNFVLELQTQTSIPINAGVTYRIAHAGFIGSELRQEYTCFGRGVNLAARFMTTAPRGEIWVDEGVARRAQARFDIEFEAVMPFKGFAEQQRVYVLFERKERPETLFEGKLVGREAELARLAAFVAPLWQGAYAGILLVWGEPGVGKSRLVHAFLTDETWQVSETCQVFLAQTDEILRGPFHPFRYWLRRYFGQTEGQTEARNKRSFNRALDRLIDATPDTALARELDRTRSFLGALVDLRWPDSLYEQLDPQGRYDNTLIGLISLLQAESLQGPVVLHLEDAHWLDGDSKAALARLDRTLAADERRSYPLAVIVTARPGVAESPLGETQPDQEIDLGQLSPAGLARLAEAHLGGRAGPGLLGLLAERSEGNPFFAEQTLRYLQEGEYLIRDEEGWWLAQEMPPSLLPADVRALLVARLDQLAQEVRQTVQTAAVLGREFEVQLLARMLDNEAPLPQCLMAAERAAIWSTLSQLRYIFRHALLRDTAYRMQVHARRQALHASAVGALETLYSADLAPHYGQLAYHSEQATLEAKALGYLQLAGEAARAAYQNSQAADYYTRALGWVSEGDLETRWDLILAREQVRELLGRREEQREDLHALTALADGLDDDRKRADVALRISQLALNTADYDGAVKAVQRAITLAEAAGEAATEAEGHRLWGGALREKGDFAAAQAQYERALRQAQAAGAKAVQAQGLHDVGSVAFFRANYAEAVAYYEQALDLYSGINDRRGQGLCQRSLAVVANSLGEYARARLHADQALRIAREVGHRADESRCLITLANAAVLEGDLVGAQGHLEQALRTFRALADRAWEGLCLINLGVTAWRLGDHPAADAYLKQALDIQQKVGNRWMESGCLYNLGIVARDAGAHAQARSYLEQGLVICRELGLRAEESGILSELGVVATDQGNHAPARAAFEEALALRQEAGNASQQAETLAGLASVSLAQGDVAQALALAEEVLLHLQENPELSEAERPLRVYVICYQVLEAADDPRAQLVLERAHDLLQARAAKIPAGARRRSFLQNVGAHREIVHAFQQRPGSSELPGR